MEGLDNDQTKSTMLVVGATGSIGPHVVVSALNHGYAVRALIRTAGQWESFPAGVETVVGDLTRPETLFEPVAGVDAIVFTHGTYGDPAAAEAVDYGAVRNILAVLAGRKVRIALMSTIGVTDRKGSHDWKRRGERLVRASGMPYTVVRPGWFDHNGPDEHRIVMLQGDRPLSRSPADGAISRRQLAEVLVRSLSSDVAQQKTFELLDGKGAEQNDLDPIFASLEPDPPNALVGVYDRANMDLEGEPQRVLDDLNSIRVQSRRQKKHTFVARRVTGRVDGTADNILSRQNSMNLARNPQSRIRAMAARSKNGPIREKLPPIEKPLPVLPQERVDVVTAEGVFTDRRHKARSLGGIAFDMDDLIGYRR